MIEGAALQVADLAARARPQADGYMRIDVDREEWRALAQGCAAGSQDLTALWFDAGRMVWSLRQTRWLTRSASESRATSHRSSARSASPTSRNRTAP